MDIPTLFNRAIRQLFGPQHLWVILCLWMIIAGVGVVVANALAAG